MGTAWLGFSGSLFPAWEVEQVTLVDYFFCSIGFRVTFRGLGEIYGFIEEVSTPQSPEWIEVQIFH